MSFPAHNIVELVDIFKKMFLSQRVKQNVIITNKNVKCQLTAKLQNDIRLKKISKLHEIIVFCPIFFPKWKYCQY